MSKIRRRIGHFVEGENGTFDFVIARKDFNEDCYAELNKYIAFIFKLQPILISYEAIEVSYNEHSELIKKYNDHFLNAKAPDTAQINIFLSYLVESTQKTTNFLSSVTSFFSCAEVRLKKEFGKSSTKFNEWNEYRKTLYSQSFPYRFLYELRNYSQHHYLPVSNIDIKLDNIVIGERSLSNTISIDRDELLSSGYKWSQLLKSDINKLDKKIHLSPIIDEYVSSIRQIAYRYIAVYREEIEDCLSYMDSLNRVFAFPTNSTPVIFIGETLKGKPVPNQVEYIPFAQFTWISKHYLQLKNYAARA
jgi:hypothetical protein